MNRIELKSHQRTRRKKGLRKRIFGVPDRPRLSVFRSAKHIYAQVIDDLSGKTIASASTIEKGKKVDKGGNKAAAEAVGANIAKRAIDAGVAQIVFDRNGFRYHGRIKILADAARKGGLKF
ncbi:MAG: 50S ribosomal protein L18 [Phycisphaerales bacterium]|nr:50S ribosomal protein L18 [Phycisphaerales bacterium]MCI0632102.1 50S ribosomal protein L18 [Phycisphaerales bacterium]MCI0676795.1 50S ribosomal protein L18 [Phycisphaerales bacterium]